MSFPYEPTIGFYHPLALPPPCEPTPGYSAEPSRYFQARSARVCTVGEVGSSIRPEAQSGQASTATRIGEPLYLPPVTAPAEVRDRWKFHVIGSM